MIHLDSTLEPGLAIPRSKGMVQPRGRSRLAGRSPSNLIIRKSGVSTCIDLRVAPDFGSSCCYRMCDTDGLAGVMTRVDVW